MAQTSQQPSHPHHCAPCSLVFESPKSWEVHLAYCKYSKNNPEFQFNRSSPSFQSYVLGPGSDFPVIPQGEAPPHSPQPNSATHSNPSFRFHPYNHSNNSYPPESPRNNVSSSSPGVNNQQQPRLRPFQCDRCSFIGDSSQRLLDHITIAHSKSPSSNFQFNDCFPAPAAKPLGVNQAEEILDLDSQKVHVYNPALNEESEGNEMNGRNHSVNAMVSSWVNNVTMPEKKYYQVNQQNGSLPSPDFPSVSSTTISPPNSENMQIPPLNNFHFEGKPQIPSQISSSSSQTIVNLPNPVPNGKSGKSPSGGGSWKSNEARRPKTYNCSACNKWFTSSGHLKRHYNTTLHKNAVKQSNQPDPASLPISAHHHPHKDPAYVASLQGSVQCSPSPRTLSEDGPIGPGSQIQVKSESESLNAPNSRNVSPQSHFNSSYANFLSNSPNLMAGPSEHQSGGLLLSHPQLSQINPHHPAMNSHLPHMNPHLHAINSHMPPISSHLTINPHQYPHVPQYTQTSNMQHIQSTSPIQTIPTHHQFIPLATSTGMPPSQCQGSAVSMPMMNYPNLQPPHVSSTQEITNNNNFGNLSSEVIEEFSDIHHNDTFFSASNMSGSVNQFQNLNFGITLEPNYFEPQGIINCNEDVGGHKSPLSAEFKAQSPHDESYSLENSTQINSNSSSSNTITNGSPDSGLETSPSPFDSKDFYKFNAFEDLKDVSIQNNNAFLVKVTVLDSALNCKKKKKSLPKKKSFDKSFNDKNQIVSSTFDSFSLAEPDSPIVENQKVHKCEECDKIFNRSCYLTQHNKSFHSGIEKPFKCNRCGKRFVAESLQIEHLSKHQGDKPFKCEICPKQFNHKTDLRRHMCLHSGEKPFSCSVCQKGFIRKDHMIKHTETHKRKQNNPAMYNKVHISEAKLVS